jgi:uncharacterized repeat protein (TIGR01451 family)
MKQGAPAGATYEPWPHWWRMVLIAICTLILCSCRSAPPASVAPSPLAATPPALPPQAYTGMPGGYPCVPSVAEAAVAAGPVADPSSVPSSPVGPWAPPGLRNQPWPQDEYLCDGGDAVPHSAVGADWEIRGLNVEDTIGHFDTVDGRRIVAPSNRVCIYSPRFGSVRQVVSLQQNEQRDPCMRVYQPVNLVRHEGAEGAASSQQHYQAEADVTRKLPVVYRSKQGDGAMSSAAGLRSRHSYAPLDSLASDVRQDTLEEAEMAWLAHGVNAAITWSGVEPLMVLIDRQKAAAEVSDDKLASLYTIRERERNPKLRVIKTASTQFAAPGETIEFTIRFDNVGDEVIGNVTIIDNLTTRLEYVPDSDQCDLDANFLTEPNEGDSLALRWEIANPLQPGEAGVIRFRCRVR